MFTGIMIILFGIICYNIGWINAHKTIATECKKLERFYVGKEVFHCVKIEEKNESNIDLNKNE